MKSCNVYYQLFCITDTAFVSQAPPAIYEGAVAAGAAKAAAPWAKIFKLGIAAGCHIGFGSYLAITVGGACPQIAEANPGLQKVSKYKREDDSLRI
jgi:formate/nitrite transporter FocA (FNT family)